MPENTFDRDAFNIDTLNIDELIGSIKTRLDQHLQAHQRKEPLFVGIHTGGVWIARRLQRMYEAKTPLGELNIAFYRDDFSRLGLHPQVTPSNLPFDIENRHIVLIDDVLYTGRTIRAAMNELFDYGRPASISLVVLVDRSGRELPVQADVTGGSLRLNAGEHVKLRGPEPLALEIL